MTKGAFHSTKISGNSGPKLSGTVLSNRRLFGKEGPPFEVDRLFRSDRSDRKLLFHFCLKLNGTVWSNRDGVTNRNISRCTVPFVPWNVQNFKPEFLVDWKVPKSLLCGVRRFMFEAWVFALAYRERLPDTVDFVLSDLYSIFNNYSTRARWIWNDR